MFPNFILVTQKNTNESLKKCDVSRRHFNLFDEEDTLQTQGKN